MRPEPPVGRPVRLLILLIESHNLKPDSSRLTTSFRVKLSGLLVFKDVEEGRPSNSPLAYTAYKDGVPSPFGCAQSPQPAACVRGLALEAFYGSCLADVNVGAHTTDRVRTIPDSDDGAENWCAIP